MHFPDLMKRTLTASMMVVSVGLWLFACAIIPWAFFLGIAVLMGISLYEWANISKIKPSQLRYWGFLGIILGFMAWIRMYQIGHIWNTMWTLACAMFSDVMAYFGGRIFQGPKLCPRISPSKTYAGAICSLILAPFCTMFVFNLVGMKLCGGPSIWSGAVFWFAWPFFLCLCIAAQMGDLLESVAKRFYGVKDSGTWLPGHGGLLDRLDSILSVFVAWVFIYDVVIPLYGYVRHMAS
jgi:phosphatidate cytidylyltransferase